MTTNKESLKKAKFLKIISIIFFSLFVLWFVLTKIDQKVNQRTQELSLDSEYSFDELVDNDQDGDGVEDWRELLIGTNPLAFDTNEDGLDDGTLYAAIDNIYNSQEITALKTQYPDASDEELLTLLSANFNSEENNLTLSEKAGREFYVAGTLLNNLGALTPELEKQMQEGFIEDNVFAYPYPLRIFTDFTYNEEYFPESELVYANDLLRAINFNYLDPEPLNILENSFNTENEDLPKKGLELTVTNLKNIVTTLDAITIPTIYAEEHMELTNSFVRLMVDVTQMRDFYDDPLLGYTAMLRYKPNIHSHRQIVEIVTTNITKNLEELANSINNVTENNS